MGMYLMRQIGTRGVYAHPVLPDFMVFLNWPELPVYWYGFQHFPYAAADGRAGAGRARLRVRLVRVPQPRHRRLSVDHHPGADLRADARLLPQQFRLRRQQRPHRFQGHPRLQRAGAGHARGAVRRSRASRCGSASSSAASSSARSSARCWSRSATPRRARASSATGSRPTSCSCSRCRPAWPGVAGALYVPQVGIINPSEFSPANSIEAVIWVAVGGRGTLIGAVLGAVLVNYGKTYFTTRLARALLAVRARRPVRRGDAAAAARHRRHRPALVGRAAAAAASAAQHAGTAAAPAAAPRPAE